MVKKLHISSYRGISSQDEMIILVKETKQSNTNKAEYDVDLFGC